MNDFKPLLMSIKELAVKVSDTVDLMIASMNVEAKAEEAKVEAINEEPKKVISLEEVRKVLAGLSRDGYTKDVRILLEKHGATKLSAINADEYESILKEAEEIGHGE